MREGMIASLSSSGSGSAVFANVKTHSESRVGWTEGVKTMLRG